MPGEAAEARMVSTRGETTVPAEMLPIACCCDIDPPPPAETSDRCSMCMGMTARGNTDGGGDRGGDEA